MHKLIKISLAAALPALWAAGCSDFLKGGELTNNPNVPVQGSATNSQLFIAIQTSNWSMNSSELAWAVAQWMQELYGAARQQVGIYNYSGITNATFDGDFQYPYIGGGLVDIRQLQAQATAQNDLFYLGVAQVMEAWVMSQTADQWGDIPYSQAVNYATYPTPVLDTQQSVYDSVENLLTTAIANITSGTGAGPGAADLAYGGSSAKWAALAHTLKARIYLHMVPPGWATYAQVITEANQGIASSAGDFVAAYSSGSQFSTNQWWQFMSQSGGTGRAGDMIALNSTQLPAMLLAAGDPRYGEYFDSTNATNGFMSSYRLDPGFQQPLATWAENQLILAEATFQTSGAAAALPFLQAEQNGWHVAAKWHNALPGVAVAGAASMAAIMNEKYITMFQHVEVWNDWKRTCIPALSKITTGTPNPLFPGIPARVYYGLTEQQTNSANVPAPGTAPNIAFNSNDVLQGCGT